VARSRHSMLEVLPSLMAMTANDDARERLRRATDFIVEPFDKPWSQRFVDLVEEQEAV